ncbi:formate-dependent phosphoribosylglycinamide formyltransferase [Mycobacterium basiliense]|uniref:formate-dependent phosphoribosylglycinamide formyltransferase n=1 Tax=Mycobacterium basiliense TaxID=2094119 RepID=UPI0038CC0C26
MTDGLTEGHGEPLGNHEHLAVRDEDSAPAGDKTTAITVSPATAPRAEAEAGVGPRVLLLGAGEFGRELAVALQGFGAEVIAADGYPDAPAHRVADQSLVVTLTDGDELGAVLARLRPDFVVTLTDAVNGAALDAFDSSQARDSDSGAGFTELVPNARSVRLLGDREGLRKLAADELGLPTAPFWFVGSLGELEAVAAHAGYPLLVRPATKADGRRHSVVRERAGINEAWERATAGGAAGAQPRVWAEMVVDVEFLITLIVVCTEAANGPVIEFCAPIGHRVADGGQLEAWQPQKMSAAAFDAAKSIAARIVKALGGRGVFGVELMINGDEVYFADVTAWPGDTSWVTRRTQRLSVFELQARAILGVAVDTLMVSPGAAWVIGPGRASASGAPGAHAFQALTAALSVPESDVRVFGRAGAGAPGKRAVALATAPDVAIARDRAREVAARLDMPDSRG